MYTYPQSPAAPHSVGGFVICWTCSICLFVQNLLPSGLHGKRPENVHQAGAQTASAWWCDKSCNPLLFRYVRRKHSKPEISQYVCLPHAHAILCMFFVLVYMTWKDKLSTCLTHRSVLPVLKIRKSLPSFCSRPPISLCIEPPTQHWYLNFMDAHPSPPSSTFCQLKPAVLKIQYCT